MFDPSLERPRRPVVSVVTPSYQQGRFLERTLESVAMQDGALEHIVMDGGSTDGTLAILERWRDRITFKSERDRGQTAAINAGMSIARGEILAYLNSDDVYYPGAIAAAVAAFERDPSVDVVYGDADHIDVEDRVIGAYPIEEWSIERLKLVCFLCQPAVFLRRRVIERFGAFDENLHYCMDYEYWLRLALRGARFAHLPARLAGSRLHGDAKTFRSAKAAHVEINDMLKRHLGGVPDNWLWNYAAVDSRAVVPVALRSIAAAFRWNGFPSITLLRTIASWLLGRTRIAPPLRFRETE
ncbi:MAG: glycosyltransferase [Acidobacteria bacterium]|nr:MAG: glycosyltransferase [Acidobacteriota bacterium]